MAPRKRAAPGKKKLPPRLRPVTFMPVERVFKPQIKVRCNRDLNGWANREKGVKWHLGQGQIGCVDEDIAREWYAKGYVEILDGTIRPVSEDEAAEFLSTVTVIGIGADNG